MNIMELYVKCRNLCHNCGFIIHDEEEKNYLNFEEIPFFLAIKPVTFFEIVNAGLMEVWF